MLVDIQNFIDFIAENNKGVFEVEENRQCLPTASIKKFDLYKLWQDVEGSERRELVASGSRDFVMGFLIGFVHPRLM